MSDFVIMRKLATYKNLSICSVCIISLAIILRWNQKYTY